MKENTGAPTIAPTLGIYADLSGRDLHLDTRTSLPNRALDTVYQNVSDKTRLVSITASVRVTGPQPDEIIGYSVITGRIGSSSPPGTYASQTGINPTMTGFTIGSSFEEIVNMTFLVPPGYYYRAETSIANGGVTPTLAYWQECDLR